MTVNRTLPIVATALAALPFVGCSASRAIPEAKWVEIDPAPRDAAGGARYVVLAAGDGAGYAVYEQYLALQVRDRIEAYAEARVDHPAP